MSTTSADSALVLELDGVLNPTSRGLSPGEDPALAGHPAGAHDSSPALVRRLEDIAAQRHVTAAWLTDWPAKIQTRMRGSRCAEWPDIGVAHRYSLPPKPGIWWKPRALRAWLDAQPSVTRLAWCDSNLAFPRTSPTERIDLDLIPLLGHHALAGRRLFTRDSTQAVVHRPGLSVLLTAPDPGVGLTSVEVVRLDRFLGRFASSGA